MLLKGNLKDITLAVFPSCSPACPEVMGAADPMPGTTAVPGAALKSTRSELKREPSGSWLTVLEVET